MGAERDEIYCNQENGAARPPVLWYLSSQLDGGVEIPRLAEESFISQVVEFSKAGWKQPAGFGVWGLCSYGLCFAVDQNGLDARGRQNCLLPEANQLIPARGRQRGTEHRHGPTSITGHQQRAGSDGDSKKLRPCPRPRRLPAMPPRINIPPVTRIGLIALGVQSILSAAIRYRQWTANSEIVIPYLNLVPQLSLVYPWTFVTTTLVESNIFTFSIACLTLHNGGRYLERAWSSAELAKFLVVVSLVPNILCFSTLTALFAFTRNERWTYVGPPP